MQLVQELGKADVVETKINEPQFTLEYEGVSITLLGTAHVSGTSAATVRQMIDGGDYDAVAVELCANRHQALIDPDAITNMNLSKVMRSGKGPMVMASLALGAFQKRVADQLGVEPGADMRAAVETASQHKLPIILVDRDIGTTFKRIYRNVPWWRRITVISGLLASVIARRTVTEEEIENLKQSDVLESTFNQFAEHSEEIYTPLVDERDQYMVAKLMCEAKAAGYKRLLVVIGAGHLKGMRQYFNQSGEKYIQQPEKVIDALNQVPPAGYALKLLPWVIVVVILAGFVAGFSTSSDVGWEMVKTWVLINGCFAAIGATIAAAHPITILSAFAAAPLTSLNPTISAGVVSAAIETVFRKPRVGDFSDLRNDAGYVRGWWKNRVARTLLVFLFTSIGSAIGTYVAGYKMLESINMV